MEGSPDSSFMIPECSQAGPVMVCDSQQLFIQLHGVSAGTMQKYFAAALIPLVSISWSD